jgi:hypothetical protein
MQYNICQTANSSQLFGIIKVTRYRHNAQRTQCLALCVISQQCKNAVMLQEQGNSAPRDIAATDDEQSFHGLIMR